MKQCTKCKEWKDIDAFSKDKTQCKQCIRDRVREYRKTEHGKKVTELYNQSKDRKVAYTKYNNSPKSETTRRKYIRSDKAKQTVRRFWANNPEKRKAGEAVMRKVIKGLIPPASSLQCVHCPKQAQSYHHYKGYEKEHWLDVIPLCARCHRKADRVTKQNNHKMLQ